MEQEVFIIAAKRTPIGGFMGSLAHYSATALGGAAIRAAYEASGLDKALVSSVYMGNVLSANLGQSPARQAAIDAGLPAYADATTINKVCASGMKATMLGTQQITTGLDEIVVTGGMESMSNVPHYVPLRQSKKYGDTTMIDGVRKDGLWDPYHDFHMGNAAEICVREYQLSREAQDAYALLSYERAVQATAAGKFASEMITLPGAKKGAAMVTADEDIYKLIPEKVSSLPPAFETGGTITAANASNLNDGAAALVLASAAMVARYQLQPLARIVSFADAAQAPEWFTTSPSIAIPKALDRAGLSKNDISYWELNEAYASVILANSRILDIDQARINVYGGAVAMGHPIGASGARIICTLLSVLQQEGGRYGVAAICNGGGGASAMVLEKM